MKFLANRSALYTLSGIGIGLVASLAVRVLMGLFVEMSADQESMILFGISGMMLGAYFGYMLSHQEDGSIRSLE